MLICLEASADDAERTAWTKDVRLFAGYDAGRPATARDCAPWRSRAEVASGTGASASS